MGNSIFLGNARTALKFALNNINFLNNEVILLPELICDVVLHPINKLGIKYNFYKINLNLEPDWEDIINKIQHNNVKAILCVHFFGNPVSLNKFLNICNKNGIILIEDNAHGYSGIFNNKLLGTFGNYGISSPRKFLNIPTGGILYINEKFTNNIILSNYNLFNFKDILKIILFLFPIIYHKIKSINTNNLNWDNPFLFKENIQNDYKIDFLSKCIIKNYNWDKYATTRRKNWHNWERFGLQNGIKPVYKELLGEANPWMIPFMANSINERNLWIKWGNKNKINITTWPTLPIEIVENKSNAYNIWEKLFCIPLDFSPNETLKFNEN